MELNREKVMEGLRCCADENSCEGKCPYYSNVVTVCSTNLAKDTLSLIKELTEERENYKNIAEKQQSISMERHFEIKRLNEENERLNKEVDRLSQAVLYNNSITEMKVEEAKADTVKKMQERLKKAFNFGHTILEKSICDIIDQIAKELLEENDE